jgi:surfeit locus 1 family protein
MADSDPATERNRGWRLWAFVVFMLVLMGLFVGLGAWQVERLGEKERLIASVAARAGLPPIALPPVGEWGAFDPEPFGFRAVTLTGQWLPQQTVLVFTSLEAPRGARSGPGYWVMTPLALSGSGTVYVNRGYIPQESAAAFVNGGTVASGEVTLTGVARLAESVGAFTPAPDAAHRIDYVRNPERLQSFDRTLAGPIAPIYVDLPAGDAGALPQGGETVMEFPNNHLGYAITWFGFALLVPPLLILWVRRQRRVTAKP